jgi:hypothetical protein
MRRSSWLMTIMIIHCRRRCRWRLLRPESRARAAAGRPSAGSHGRSYRISGREAHHRLALLASPCRCFDRLHTSIVVAVLPQHVLRAQLVDRLHHCVTFAQRGADTLMFLFLDSLLCGDLFVALRRLIIAVQTRAFVSTQSREGKRGQSGAGGTHYTNSAPMQANITHVTGLVRPQFLSGIRTFIQRSSSLAFWTTFSISALVIGVSAPGRLAGGAVFLPPVDSPRCRTVAGPGGAIGAASRRLQLRTVNGTATTLSLRAAAGIPRSSMANGRLRGAAGPVREPW